MLRHLVVAVTCVLIGALSAPVAGADPDPVAEPVAAEMPLPPEGAPPVDDGRVVVAAAAGHEDARRLDADAVGEG